jgi:hypothetical protein
MKITLRFPRQHGHRDEEYEAPAIPESGTMLFGNNQIIYKVTHILWEIEVDPKICRAVLVLEHVGEQDPPE